jgi:hypothetical protein
MINKGLKVFFFIFSIFTGKRFEKNWKHIDMFSFNRLFSFCILHH